MRNKISTNWLFTLSPYIEVKLKRLLKYLYVIAALAVLAVLGQQERIASAQSAYNNQPMVVELLELTARKVQGGSGTDETYLLADGKRIWKHDSDKGETHHLDGEIQPLVFWGYIDITLKEEDDWPSGDDTLGTVRIRGEDYEQKIKPGYSGLDEYFRQDDANYMLIYRVRPATREEIGFNIIPKHSGKCLDIPAPNWTKSGTSLQQWDCYGLGQLNQWWRLIPAGNGYYQIAGTYRNRHKCLDVEGYSTSNGASVKQYNCHGKSNQLWRLRYMGNGYYQIISKHSGKCLDVTWDSITHPNTNGARVQQWECIGSNQPNQLWRFLHP